MNPSCLVLKDKFFKQLNEYICISYWEKIGVESFKKTVGGVCESDVILRYLTIPKEEAKFRRLSQSTALCGTTTNVPTLFGNPIPLSFTEVIRPNTVKNIPGQGLPYPKDTSRKGDLLVTFDIKFPERLTSTTKEMLTKALPGK